jgi:heme exporter protein A
MQQRLAIARAVLHDPDILLLDEPDTGLDQQAFASIGGFVDRTEGPPRTVVLATHDLPLALSLCSRFVVLAAGRVTADVPKAGLDALGLERLYWHATERI